MRRKCSTALGRIEIVGLPAEREPAVGIIDARLRDAGNALHRLSRSRRCRRRRSCRRSRSRSGAIRPRSGGRSRKDRRPSARRAPTRTRVAILDCATGTSFLAVARRAVNSQVPRALLRVTGRATIDAVADMIEPDQRGRASCRRADRRQMSACDQQRRLARRAPTHPSRRPRSAPCRRRCAKPCRRPSSRARPAHAPAFISLLKARPCS